MKKCSRAGLLNTKIQHSRRQGPVEIRLCELDANVEQLRSEETHDRIKFHIRQRGIRAWQQHHRTSLVALPERYTLEDGLLEASQWGQQLLMQLLSRSKKKCQGVPSIIQVSGFESSDLERQRASVARRVRKGSDTSPVKVA